MKTLMYKGVLVGNGALRDALDIRDEALASKTFKETGLRFEETYGKEAASWFYSKAKEFA